MAAKFFLFKTVRRNWNCFLQSVGTDGKLMADRLGLKLEKIGPTFSSFNAWSCKNQSIKKWRHKKLNLWNFKELSRYSERTTSKMPTCQKLGGGAEDLGLNKVKFCRSPFERYFTEVIPLITFEDFRDSPSPISSFSEQIWVVPPLNPSKLFSDPPFWVISYDWSHPVLLKIKWFPPKSFASPSGDK